MNTKRLQIIFSIAFIFLLINLQQPSSAGTLQEVKNDTYGHRIIVYDQESMTISADERSYVKHGAIWQKDGEYWHAPKWLSVEVHIDGEAIKLKQFSYLDKTNSPWQLYRLYYQVFEAGYFEPGVYDWRVNWEVWDVDGTYTLELSNQLIVT